MPSHNADCPDIRTDLVQHLPRLQRYARALTRDPAAAEDLVQSCIERALAKAHLFDGSDLGAWLSTILYHAHINSGRRQARYGTPIDLDNLPQDLASRLTTPSTAEAIIEIKEIAQQIHLLAPERREALLLVASGWSYEDALDKINQNRRKYNYRKPLLLGTLRSRLARDREALRYWAGT